MKKIAFAVGSAALAAGAAAVIGTGTASAVSPSDVVGQKYSDATSALSGAGYKVIVGTTIGDRQSWPDCVVANAQARTVQPPENSSGASTNEMVVSLNCDSGAASNKQAGYSAGSPEGRAAKAAEASAAAQASAEATPGGN